MLIVQGQPLRRNINTAIQGTTCFFLWIAAHHTFLKNHSRLILYEDTRRGHTGVKGGSESKGLTDATRVFPWI